MTYNLAKVDLIKSLLNKIFEEYPEIPSQKILYELIKNELNKIDKNIKISPKRLRIIAIRDMKIKVNIEYKEMDKSSENLKRCPICNSELKDIYNYTLDGNKVYVGKRCEFCQYWTGIKLRLPKRYTFYR
ncbi:MAG: hypothetical protein ACP5JT_00305 [Thermoplasmata archaeon]